MHKIEDQTKFYNSKAEKTGWRDFIRPDFINLPSCQAAQQLPNFRNRKAIAFTMAEILISLTIIGVIAAITLPSLKANINEKAWATQRKVLYSRLSQAISMLPSLNLYGNYAGTWEENIVTPTEDTAAQAFVTEGLGKILKINNICSISINTSSEDARNELKKCGISPKITTMSDSKINVPTKLSELNSRIFIPNEYGMKNKQNHIDTRASAFITSNGESILTFYNPLCTNFENSLRSQTDGWSNMTVCANFIYDLNGLKGPNKIGKDMGFITALYPTESEVVAPMPLNKNFVDKAGNLGSNNYNNSAANCRSMDNNSRVPNKEEAAAMAYNRNLIGLSSAQYVTSSSYSELKYWEIILGDYRFILSDKTSHGYLRCIKR